MRRISDRMMRRRVERWGWYSERLLVVVFSDGKMAFVDPAEEKYSSIRAWNAWIRNEYARLANIHAEGLTLGDVVRLARARMGVRQNRLRSEGARGELG